MPMPPCICTASLATRTKVSDSARLGGGDRAAARRASRRRARRRRHHHRAARARVSMNMLRRAVLERLERADRHAELLALLQVRRASSRTRAPCRRASRRRARPARDRGRVEDVGALARDAELRVRRDLDVVESQPPPHTAVVDQLLAGDRHAARVRIDQEARSRHDRRRCRRCAPRPRAAPPRRRRARRP